MTQPQTTSPTMEHMEYMPKINIPSPMEMVQGHMGGVAEKFRNFGSKVIDKAFDILPNSLGYRLAVGGATAVAAVGTVELLGADVGIEGRAEGNTPTQPGFQYNARDAKLCSVSATGKDSDKYSGVFNTGIVTSKYMKNRKDIKTYALINKVTTGDDSPSGGDCDNYGRRIVKIRGTLENNGRKRNNGMKPNTAFHILARGNESTYSASTEEQNIILKGHRPYTCQPGKGVRAWDTPVTFTWIPHNSNEKRVTVTYRGGEEVSMPTLSKTRRTKC